MRSDRELDVWRKGIELSSADYGTTRSFPAKSCMVLVSQLRRAAVSIPANLAEGHARGSTRDFIRFISIALGSVAEVETLFVISQNLGLVESNTCSAFNDELEEIGRMLRGLQKALRKRLPSP